MRDGTVVTTRMHAFSSLIEASRTTGRVDPVTFTYGVDLGRTGGDLRAFDGVVTLQQAGATTVRRYPATVHAHGVRREQISLPATLPPGFYRVGPGSRRPRPTWTTPGRQIDDKSPA